MSKRGQRRNIKRFKDTERPHAWFHPSEDSSLPGLDKCGIKGPCFEEQS